MESEDERLLTEFAAASAQLSRLADPFGPPGPKRVEERPGMPVPHTQEGQLALLWIASYDAFEVSRTLERRAAPSVLAQLRYLSEALGLILWLVETNDEKEMRSRSLSFAQAEVRDLGSVHSEWKERPRARKQYISDAKAGVVQIKQMAEAEGVNLVGRPGRKVLADKSGVGRTAYNVMSDIGSHAGLNSPMVFFGVPGENRFVIHPQAGVLPRAYFLGLGFELYAVCASNILGAFGFGAQRRGVDSLLKQERDHLTRARHLMDTRED
jgi:hypothetical protein